MITAGAPILSVLWMNDPSLRYQLLAVPGRIDTKLVWSPWFKTGKTWTKGVQFSTFFENRSWRALLAERAKDNEDELDYTEYRAGIAAALGTGPGKSISLRAGYAFALANCTKAKIQPV